jgi:hypothetical protein
MFPTRGAADRYSSGIRDVSLEYPPNGAQIACPRRPFVETARAALTPSGARACPDADVGRSYSFGVEFDAGTRA